MTATTTVQFRNRSMIRSSQSSPALMLSRSDETNTSTSLGTKAETVSLRSAATFRSAAEWPMKTDFGPLRPGSSA